MVNYDAKKKQFRMMIHNTDLEYGFYSNLDYFLEDELQKNNEGTQRWLLELFMENQKDVTVLMAILRTLAHMKYKMVKPLGLRMALAALNHDDEDVRDCGVRCLENWECTEALPVLKSLRYPEEWLQKYVEQVIRDLTK
jgi:hypothetical protein